MSNPLMNISILPLDAIECLHLLHADAEANGTQIVTRLIEDWNSGLNRFDQPGEQLWVARSSEIICGVCGLNRDPFAGDNPTGRVRRLYVVSDFRRRGIGSALLVHLIAQARLNFSQLNLRTFDPVARAFYASHGFQNVLDDPNCTQRLSFDGHFLSPPGLPADPPAKPGANGC